MSLWGKIVGGAAGFAMGGPLGALLGLVAGHVLVDDRAREGSKEPAQADPRVARERETAFIMGVIALAAKMAKADGTVTAAEVRAFRDIVKAPPGEMKRVEWVFDLARRSTVGFESYARQIGRLFKDDPRVLEDLLDGLFHIARSDGVFHGEEDTYLCEVARLFGFDVAAYERIKARNMPESASPYAVLGLAPAASNEEIKGAYRRLVKEHHPDAMIARGVPEEFIAIATAKVAAINAAYERIQELRGKL
ncbi:MAG: TerB family tellurite resistance protein [Alphaproteobacteria bacterium]